MAQQWEYCILATAPPGPIQCTITYFKASGLEKHVYNAESYEDGMNRLWPQLIAQLGLQGWELVTVYQEGWYFKRALSAGD